MRSKPLKSGHSRVLPRGGAAGAAALAAAVLTTATPRPAAANYRQKAEEQMAFVQAHFYDAATQRYHGHYPADPKALPWAMMWDNGVQLRALADAARYDPHKYVPMMDAFAQGLRSYWDTLPPYGFTAYCSGPGGTDKYYDDNAWLVLGYVSAYQRTHDARYLEWAKQTQTFVLSGWDDKLGGGIYWHFKHESKNTCSNGPVVLAALRLYEVTGDRGQLDWALRIRKWLNATLQDRDGLYWDNIGPSGKVEKTKWSYNTALMIQANVLLSRLEHDKSYLHEAERMANASIAYWQDPTGNMRDEAAFSHLLCESLLDLYRTDHDVRYLDAVRRHATYGYRYGRDTATGGYWNNWAPERHQEGEHKSLLQQASDARIFWLLAPYRDVDELYAAGIRAARKGADARAEDLFRQAADSDPQSVEARFRLWRVLGRLHKTAAAEAVAAEMTHLSADPALRARLEALGWKPTAATAAAAAPAERAS